MKFSISLALMISFLRPILTYDNFEGLGKLGKPCFSVTDTPKTCNKTLAESYVPQSPKFGSNEPDTMVFLFTPKNQNKAEPLHLCGGRLPPGSTFDPSVNTEIFIHGWLDGVCRTAWMREMKEQLFIRGKYNVILVDWTWGNTPDYFLAGHNCRIVGEQVGFVINNIMEDTCVGPEKFHVIGHSFGAIASGFVGRKVPGLRRITALDPALAPYKYAPPEIRVTYRDAEIVDVIHSNGGQCSAFTIGDSRQLGHADFYPNGGTVQLSCYHYLLIGLLKGDILYALASLEPRLCAHLQSIQFYKVSINPSGRQFIGIESASYEDFLLRARRSCSRARAIMGMDYELDHRDDGTRKKYYLNTKLTCPY